MNIKALKRVELAEVFRVDVKTVTRWHADGMPRNGDGRYNIADCIAWRIEQADRATAGKAPDEKENSQWLERYRKERALLARFERRQRRGEFILVTEHVSTVVEILSDLRNTLLAWPSRVYPNDDTNRQKLRSETCSLLDRLREYGSKAEAA